MIHGTTMYRAWSAPKCSKPGRDPRMLEKYDVGHEAHFAHVTGNYLRYLRAGRLPDWEVPNILTKHTTIMKAYELSR